MRKRAHFLLYQIEFKQKQNKIAIKSKFVM